MKRFILLISIFGMFISNFFSQDIIYTKSQTEIKAKVLEITTDAIKYKEYDFIDGPTRNIAKSNVFMIEYSNGKKEFISKLENKDYDESTKSNSTEGLHLGFHLTSGKGRISPRYAKENQSGINGGIDLNIYFSETIGLKTGIGLQKLSVWGGDNMVGISNIPVSTDYTTFSLPLKFKFSSKRNIGLFFESGLCFMIPLSGDKKFYVATNNLTPPTFSEQTKPIVIIFESAIGINIKTSETLSLNFGLAYGRSLTNYFEQLGYHGKFLGFQMGVLFKLAK